LCPECNLSPPSKKEEGEGAPSSQSEEANDEED